MADKYENTLGAKADLLTTDFIRTVGATGVSYKNLVSDVAKTIVENYTSTLAGQTQSIKQAIDALKAETDAINAGLLNKTYPVGSIYMSTNNTNPGTLFGGTWASINGRFLLSAGSSGESKTFVAGNTGGSRYSDLVSHSHSLGNVSIASHSLSAHHHTTGSWTTGSDGSWTGSHSHTASDYSVWASAGVGLHRIDKNYYNDNLPQGTYASFLYTSGASASRKSIPTNTTSLSIPNHTHTIPNKQTSDAGSATLSHSLSGRTDMSSSQEGYREGNMPPYLVVYMWKRTA